MLDDSEVLLTIVRNQFPPVTTREQWPKPVPSKGELQGRRPHGLKLLVQKTFSFSERCVFFLMSTLFLHMDCQGSAETLRFRRGMN